MKCVIDLDQWMLDVICEKLEGNIRYYKEAQNSDAITPDMKREFLAAIPAVEADLAYYRSFNLEEPPDVSA